VTKAGLSTEHAALAELERDMELLAECERDGHPRFRTWRVATEAVVCGIGQKPEVEADLDYCAASAIAVLRRRSGGGTVVIGPGTLQYTFAVPYSLAAELEDIQESKRWCNERLAEALAASGHRTQVTTHCWGDLLLGDRKVAGVALRRRRTAMMLHGTLLESADLERIGRALRHPSREPGYRRGRTHADFLANLGRIDERALEEAANAALAKLLVSRSSTIRSGHA
jgi:lipoate-protein ligase A